jgi:hypothetical protein
LLFFPSFWEHLHFLCEQKNPLFGDSSARKKTVFPLMKGMVEKAEEQGIEFPKPCLVAAYV